MTITRLTSTITCIEDSSPEEFKIPENSNDTFFDYVPKFESDSEDDQ